MKQHMNVKRGGRKRKQNTDFMGIELRPKYKKAKSVAKGSISMLFDDKKKQKRSFMNFNQDLDKEILKLKVALRKEIPYEDLDNDENSRQRQKISANNKVRKKIVIKLLESNEDLINKLKLNSKILNNWLNYVGYLNKVEFINALKAIGIKFEENLFDDLFWLYDLNGDGVIDYKEFCLVNSLFRGRSIKDKVLSKNKKKFIFLVFFNICDDDRDGILDASKLKKVVKLGLSKEERHIMAKDKDFLKNKT